MLNRTELRGGEGADLRGLGISSSGMSRYPKGQGCEAVGTTWSDLGTRKATRVVGVEAGPECHRLEEGVAGKGQGAPVCRAPAGLFSPVCLAPSHLYLTLKSPSSGRPLDHLRQPLLCTPGPLPCFISLYSPRGQTASPFIDLWC